MASHSHSHSHLHPADLESADSVASTPRSVHDETTVQPRVRFMCSFGGKILPRPHDNELRYVGGDTRIVAVQRPATFSSLVNKLSRLSGTTNFNIKYQLPNEDLDALITVTGDEDVENMMDEYDRLTLNHKTARLRLFLFPSDADSSASSISSLLDGSTKREHWFLDALNGRPGPGSVADLERGRSEASSIVSEVPDYLFGLDNSDDPPREAKETLKPKNRNLLHENVSNSDPGSPAPVVSSPYGSTSSSLPPPYVSPVPDLPPVKTKPANPAPIMEQKEPQVETITEAKAQTVPHHAVYGGNPMWHYLPDSQYQTPPVQHIPVYYVPGPLPPGNVPVQPVQVRAQYVQPFPPPPGQIPVGLRQQVPTMGQVYSGAVRPVVAVDPYDMAVKPVRDGVTQPVYYGMNPGYPGMVASGGEQGTGSEANVVRVSQSG